MNDYAAARILLILSGEEPTTGLSEALAWRALYCRSSAATSYTPSETKKASTLTSSAQTADPSTSSREEPRPTLAEHEEPITVRLSEKNRPCIIENRFGKILIAPMVNDPISDSFISDSKNPEDEPYCSGEKRKEDEKRD